jgi:hypothetical protein
LKASAVHADAFKAGFQNTRFTATHWLNQRNVSRIDSRWVETQDHQDHLRRSGGEHLPYRADAYLAGFAREGR